MRNLRGLLGSLIGLAAGCGVIGSESDDSSKDFRVQQIEMADHGLPYFVRGDLGKVGPIDDLAAAPQALAGVLPAIAEALGVSAADLVATRAERDELGMTHVRMAQQKNGLRVVGGDVIVHVGADGAVQSVNGTARDGALTSTPSISAEEATRIAVKASQESVAATRSELTYLVANGDGELYLAWEVIVRGRDGALVNDRVYVDALAGVVIERHPRIYTAKNRVIKNGGGGVFPVATAPTIGTEGAPPTDPVALAAYNNTGLTYDCYKTLYNRDSYNAAGAILTSQVHVVFPTGGNPPTSPNNAVWSPDDAMMAYGDGDGTSMKPLAYSLDVTAHELTHAVTSATADLVYLNESGALNESLSDIMGAVCEAWADRTVTADTWLVGEDIWTPATAGDALRYMATPTKDNYSPDYYPERLLGTADNGGVHGNSGISNLAFHLLSVGGKHPRAKTAYTVQGIGIDRAGAIFQRGLTTKFTPNTNFAQARTLLETAAQELYPGSCAKTAVSLSFAAVGVGAAVPTDATPPTTAITAPANNARLTAGFQVQVTAADDQCINKVELLIDGALVQTLTAAPFNFTTDPNLAKGSHMIQVKTYDAFSASTATSTVDVTGPGTGGGTGGGADDGGSGSDTDVTGGCSTGGNGAAGALALMFATAFALRRRRTR
jgi:uncharacterized protein (TIGR03382 family)